MLCMQNLFSLFLLAAAGGECGKEKLGHSPKPQVKGLPPLTIPLKLTPMGDSPKPQVRAAALNNLAEVDAYEGH